MGRSGFEPPTHGFSVRCSEDVSAEKTETCGNPAEALTSNLTPESPKLPPDLAEIISAWPLLPEAIRAAILAIIRAS